MADTSMDVVARVQLRAATHRRLTAPIDGSFKGSLGSMSIAPSDRAVCARHGQTHVAWGPAAFQSQCAHAALRPMPRIPWPRAALRAGVPIPTDQAGRPSKQGTPKQIACGHCRHAPPQPVPRVDDQKSRPPIRIHKLVSVVIAIPIPLEVATGTWVSRRFDRQELADQPIAIPLLRAHMLSGSSRHDVAALRGHWRLPHHGNERASQAKLSWVLSSVAALP